MAIDIERLLRRVVADVFDDDVKAIYSADPKSRHVHRVRLSSESEGQRHAASYWWFEATIFDLAVSTFLVDEDDDEEDKEAALRDLALVVRACLRGEGRVEESRGLFRSRPVLTIEVDGREWELGRRTSRVSPSLELWVGPGSSQAGR